MRERATRGRAGHHKSRVGLRAEGAAEVRVIAVVWSERRSHQLRRRLICRLRCQLQKRSGNGHA